MSKGTVLVIGSINVDHVYALHTLPRPGQTLTAANHQTGLGGKGANQAVAAARAGASTAMVGCVGNDAWGLRALDELRHDHIDATGVTIHPTAETGTAVVLVDEAGENSIVLSVGANGELSAADLLNLSSLEPAVVLAQLEIPIAAVAAGLRACPSATRIVNAAPFTADVIQLLPEIEILIVNEHEYADLLIATQAADWREIPGLRTLIVTRGAQGVDLHGHTQTKHIPAVAVENVIDTTGAGDTFCGYLAACLAANDDIVTAVQTATKAAALTVTRPGAASSIRTAAEIKTTGT
jgi:ribokinase